MSSWQTHVHSCQCILCLCRCRTPSTNHRTIDTHTHSIRCEHSCAWYWRFELLTTTNNLVSSSLLVSSMNMCTRHILSLVQFSNGAQLKRCVQMFADMYCYHRRTHTIDICWLTIQLFSMERKNESSKKQKIHRRCWNSYETATDHERTLSSRS
jgi:hypothetical protein